MLKTLRTVLISPTEDVRPITSGYEVIGAEEDEPIERKKGVDERGVYWSFWALGAGVLLSWNRELDVWQSIVSD